SLPEKIGTHGRPRPSPSGARPINTCSPVPHQPEPEIPFAVLIRTPPRLRLDPGAEAAAEPSADLQTGFDAGARVLSPLRFRFRVGEDPPATTERMRDDRRHEQETGVGPAGITADRREVLEFHEEHSACAEEPDRAGRRRD